MSNLYAAIAMLRRTFHEYANADGNKDSMSKAELKAMLVKEMPELSKELKSEEVDKLMKTLDYNKDSEVDFQEFMILVSSLACISQSHSCKK